MSTRTAAWVLFLGSALALTACERSERGVIEKTVPASGTVTFQGKPLADFMVTFHPGGEKRPATGKTDSNGQFKLGTNNVGDGAVPGQHKVTLVYVGPPSATTQEPGKEEATEELVPTVKIPAKYFTLENTDLTVEVPAGGARELKIDIK